MEKFAELTYEIVITLFSTSPTRSWHPLYLTTKKYYMIFL